MNEDKDFNTLFWKEFRSKVEPHLIKEGWTWNEYVLASPKIRKIMLKDLE